MSIGRMTIKGEIGPYCLTPLWIATHPDLNGDDVRLWAFLAIKSNRETDAVEWGVAQLAAELGWIERRFQRHVKNLVAVGALSKATRFGPRGQGWNEYTVRYIAVIGGDTSVTPPGDTSVTPLTRVSSNQTQHSPKGECPPGSNSQFEPLPLVEKETTPVVARAREGDAGSVIQKLVAGYVDDVKRFGDGTPPPRQFRAAAGRAVRLALAEGETAAHISACLQVIARERKQPATLPYVLLDSHAGAPRRRPHP